MSQAKWLYHITTAERIPSIRKVGLMPSTETRWGGELGITSLGKVFFSATADKAAYYGLVAFRQALENIGLAYVPILLRLPISEIKQLKEDKATAGDFFTEKRVQPTKIEGFWQDKWSSIKELDFMNEGMFYELTDEGFKDWEGSIVGNRATDAEKDIEEFLAVKKGHLSA